MRPEQITRLAAIEEKLVDLFAEECKPDDWPGMGTAKDRGDRYWYKKNALATLTIVGRIQTVLRDLRAGDGAAGGKAGGNAPPDPSRDESIEEEAARLEKQGVSLLKKHRGKAG